MNIPNGNNPFLEQIISSYLAVPTKKANELDALADDIVGLILQAFPNELDSLDAFNLPYKDITDIIFDREDTLKSDSIYNFRQNVETVVSQSYSLGNPNQHHNANKKYIKRFMCLHDKLVEHTLLAQAQRNFIQKTVRQAQEIADETQKIAIQAQETANQAQATAQKAEQTYQSMFANYVTILGIFTAIIVTIFGGLNVIDAVIEINNQTSLALIVFIVALVMFCLIILLYFLATLIRYISQQETLPVKQQYKVWFNWVFLVMVAFFAGLMLIVAIYRLASRI